MPVCGAVVALAVRKLGRLQIVLIVWEKSMLAALSVAAL